MLECRDGGGGGVERLQNSASCMLRPAHVCDVAPPDSWVTAPQERRAGLDDVRGVQQVGRGAWSRSPGKSLSALPHRSDEGACDRVRAHEGSVPACVQRRTAVPSRQPSLPVPGLYWPTLVEQRERERQGPSRGGDTLWYNETTKDSWTNAFGAHPPLRVIAKWGALSWRPRQRHPEGPGKRGGEIYEQDHARHV